MGHSAELHFLVPLKMKKAFITILLLVILGSFRDPKINYSIEIYLLKNLKPKIENGIVTEFKFQKNDLPVLPFISDDDIESFDTSLNKIYFKKEAAKRIGALKPDLKVGIPFVLTVDREPVLTGYFCNIFSSFGCGSYVLINLKDTALILKKGLPEYSYTTSIAEKRKGYFFLQALERTGRIR